MQTEPTWRKKERKKERKKKDKIKKKRIERRVKKRKIAKNVELNAIQISNTLNEGKGKRVELKE